MIEAYELLIAGLQDEDPICQADSARLLGELACNAALPALLLYVRNSRHAYKTAGFEALMKIGDRSVVSDLKQLLEEPNIQNDWYWHMYKSVRAACAVCLLSMGSSAGLQYLNELADNGEDIFFAWFAPTLLRMQSKVEGFEQLQKRLNVETLYENREGTLREMDPSFVICVSEALACLPNEAARAAQRELCSWRSRYVRVQAADGLLQQSESAEDQEHVQSMLEHAGTEFEISGLTRILYQRKLTKNLEAVIKIAQNADDPFERAYAVEQLGLIGDQAAIDVLGSALQDSDSYVRLNAVEGLERLGDARVAGLIDTCVNDPSKRVRLQVAKAQFAREESLA